MRVIAGELKGQRLVAPRGWKVRPTSDRVREAIFSALGERVERRPRPRPLLRHRRAGDRGALARRRARRSWSTATPGRRSATSSASASASGPSWSAPTSGAGWRHGRRGAEAPRFDLVFVDAPYRLADRVGQELDTHLPRLLAEGGRAIVESGARRPLRIDSLRAAAPAPLRRRRRLLLRGGGRDERARTAPSSARAATTRSPTATSTSSPAPPHVFERVVVGVVNNPIRKEKTLFTAEERRAFIEEATADLANVEVADLLQPAGRVRPRTTARRRSSRACGRSPTSSTSSRWPSSTASSTPGSRAST